MNRVPKANSPARRPPPSLAGDTLSAALDPAEAVGVYVEETVAVALPAAFVWTVVVTTPIESETPRAFSAIRHVSHGHLAALNRTM